MGTTISLIKQSLTVRSLTIVKKILDENKELREIFKLENDYEDVINSIKQWLLQLIENRNAAKNYINSSTTSINDLSWQDIGVIRLLKYIENEGKSFVDPNRGNSVIISEPIKTLYNAVRHGKGNATKDFFLDMLFLFRQINGKLKQKLPSEQKIKSWMAKYPSGLSTGVIAKRKQNKERILKVIIDDLTSGEQKSTRYVFDKGMTYDEKYSLALKWWDDYKFHLRFATRSPEQLNKMLDYSLRSRRLKTLNDAYAAGIPFFITPYYLSLINVSVTPGKTGSDRTLRDYIFHSRELVDEFGNISAWEKEDAIKTGKPNAAGWILPPYHNVHRRYPEVAIFIPDTRGRACGGLCVSCQRMYDFQSGKLNFKLEKLNPKVSWKHKMQLLFKYFEEDTQLRDVLITGGDSFMNTSESLEQILDCVYKMAVHKRNANLKRSDGEKFAEIIRVRLGTRLPSYLPQRITQKFVNVLKEFRVKASAIGIEQFRIQIHVQSAMEVTPEMSDAVKKLLAAGWMVTNQLVFTAAASRRGHSNKLRKVLNDIGVIPYYTFSVKGFMENYFNFATNERAVQEMIEEKVIGKLNSQNIDRVAQLHGNIKNSKSILADIRKSGNMPFLGTDRNVLNLPGVGKSLTYNTIGITNDGRRILEFSHDHKRKHSPIIDKMGKIIIIESKSIANFLQQMESYGENIHDYSTIWGYSISTTNTRLSVFNYPEYKFKITDRLTNYQGL